MEFQILVGSETVPQYPIRSLAEFAYHLEKALDLTASVEGISISGHASEPTNLLSGWTSSRPARGLAAARNSQGWILQSAAAAISAEVECLPGGAGGCRPGCESSEDLAGRGPRLS